MKLCWLDLETTGTQPGHEIIECAIIIDINGEIKEEKEWLIKPLALEQKYIDSGMAREIDGQALAVSGTTLEDLQSPDRILPRPFFKELLSIFDKYVNRYEKTDKFTMAGHNVEFDQRFLRDFFLLNNDPYFGSWFHWDVFNLMYALKTWEVMVGKRLESKKLEDIGKAFGVEFHAHRAMDDIKATREIFYRIVKDLKE
jgi:DNA polymerase III subunit epsilon